MSISFKQLARAAVAVLTASLIAACGVPQADGSEAVVLFVVARAHDEGWRLLHRLRAAAEAYLAHPVVGALPVRRIPHTSSGKPQRHSLARQWQLGAFAELLQAFHAHAPQAPAPAPANDGLVRQVVQPGGKPVIGKFIQTVLDFLIVAFAIFMGVKAINRLKREEAVAPTTPPVPTPQETLLTEIRDLLKTQNQNRLP